MQHMSERGVSRTGYLVHACVCSGRRTHFARSSRCVCAFGGISRKVQFGLHETIFGRSVCVCVWHKPDACFFLKKRVFGLSQTLRFGEGPRNTYSVGAGVWVWCGVGVGAGVWVWVWAWVCGCRCGCGGGCVRIYTYIPPFSPGLLTPPITKTILTKCRSFSLSLSPYTHL